MYENLAYADLLWEENTRSLKSTAEVVLQNRAQKFFNSYSVANQHIGLLNFFGHIFFPMHESL